MVGTRGVIRASKRPAGTPTDDRLWPVIAALVVLGASLAAVIIAHLRFDDPRWLANAWTWLAAVLAALGGAVAAIRQVGGRLVKRSMQLALVTSVIIHVMLISAATEIVVFSRASTDVPPVEDQAREKTRTTAPDYHWRRISPLDDSRPDYTRPVETETPETEAATLDERAPEGVRTPTDLQPAPLAEPEKTIRSNLLQRRSLAETAPRLAERLAQLSRQPAHLTADTAAPVAAPPATPAASAKQLEIRPEATILSRQLVEVRLARRILDHQPTPTIRPQDAMRAGGAGWELPRVSASPPTTLQRGLAWQPVVTSPPIALPEHPNLARDAKCEGPESSNLTVSKTGTQHTADLEPVIGAAANVRQATIEMGPVTNAKRAFEWDRSTLVQQAAAELAAPRRPTRDELGPALSVTAGGAGALKRSPWRVSTSPVASSAAAAAPEIEMLAKEEALDLGDLAARAELSAASHPSVGAVAVDAAATRGDRGPSDHYAVEAGLSRQSGRSETAPVKLGATRFARRDLAGTPNWNTSAVAPADPYKHRSSRLVGDRTAAAQGSPGPQTEEAVELGLLFLARRQRSDGSWSLNRVDEEVSLASDTAATGLALLTFQGAGYHHKEHKYADAAAAAIRFLLQHQKADGDLFLPMDENSNGSVWLYSHAIAALALCEAYGMTQDPQLREPTQRAIDFIVASQHKVRGGWRYSPNYGSDTSVTGWMMMALKSGELAGLNVPSETYQGISAWLDAAQASPTEPQFYCYNPLAPDTPTQRHGRRASKTMTAVGLLMRLYGGWRRDHQNMILGAEYLQQNPPSLGAPQAPDRDTYYWYYATQVMFHMGGQYWESWNRRLHPLLVASQIQQGPLAGSWDPHHPVPDRWGPQAGRLYVTTMNLLSLEVYYRLLPLYDETAK